MVHAHCLLDDVLEVFHAPQLGISRQRVDIVSNPIHCLLENRIQGGPNERTWQ